ncbi:PREDICTED: uncharacterized protein LOC109472761 isoform X2 [Branchiostoma belcheri]|uniref:Uncharacterized protein LOC109472761 isoform X2 n=1 Tax=Branchiostoma belcheri TaxID=7741 RepID=A0A6P4YV01_BRABE|nr:PREDICTED: uncharacterized protein LOC109472761 isoform X2 [Branchiostoma belcheri]
MSLNGGCEQTCTNTTGSFQCSCLVGFSLSSDGFTCDDVDECTNANGGCDQNCTNSIGSFLCSCETGYSLNADGFSCDDINECTTENGGCEQMCNNTIGSFQCSCHIGYVLNIDGLTCEDIDECNTTNGGCAQICNNTIGSFECLCRTGYILNINGLTCDDIDECDTANGDCGQFCNNTLGGYNCYCASGYSLAVDQFACDGFDPASNLSCSFTTTTSISLTWTKPVADIRGYSVTYIPTSGIYQPSLMTSFQSRNDTSAVISSLYSGVQYSFTVLAFGMWNDSANASVTCITELPPPTNFSVSRVGAKSVTVRWLLPARALVVGYKVWVTDKETTVVTSIQYVPTSAVSATFTSLIPATEYLVAGTCVNSHIAGPQANVIAVTDTDGPRDLIIEDVKPSSLFLSWVLPVAKLTGYELTYGSVQQHKERRSTGSLTLPGNTDRYLLQGLVPSTQYMVSLTAISLVGRSEKVSLTGTTATDPPTELTVRDASSTWMCVMWTPPVAAVVAYDLKVIDAISQEEIHFSIPYTIMEFNITGLFPKTKYVVRIAAVSMYGRSVEDGSFGSTVAMSVDNTDTDALSSKATTMAPADNTIKVTAFWLKNVATTPQTSESTPELDPFMPGLLETTTSITTDFKPITVAPTSPSASVQHSDGGEQQSAELKLTPLEQILRLKDRIDQHANEETLIENLIDIITTVSTLVETVDSTPPSSDFVLIWEEAIDLLSKSSELIRATQGSTKTTMEKINDAIATTVSSLVQMTPTQNYTTVDDSVDLFEMDVIDVHSVDVSPKQQLKNIRDQQLTSQLQRRGAALSLMDSIDRAANSLLDILPHMEDYATTFHKDEIAVVIARSTKNSNVTLQAGQVTVSASTTNCSSDDSADVKMVVMKRNLFSWDASTSKENVITPVSKFSMRSQRCSLQLIVTIPLTWETVVGRQYTAGNAFDEYGSNLDDAATGRNNRTMDLHAFDVHSSTLPVVMRLYWWDRAATFRMFFRYDTTPTQELYDDMIIVNDWENVALHRGTNILATFTPNIQRKQGRLYVGIQKSEPRVLLQTAHRPEDYVLQASTLGCVNWNHATEKWQDTNCAVQVDLSDSFIRCNCSFRSAKAAIAGSLHLIPNFIDFDNVFGKPDSLHENGVVFYTVISEWALYLLMIIIFNVDFQRLREKTRGRNLRRRKQLPQLSVLLPNRMPAQYLYQITVTTGSMFGAGTSARIGFQLFGSNSTTVVKVINPGGESLVRGGTYDLIMPLKTSLGHLELLQIWHDNTGADEASWFLRDMIVKDLHTDQVYRFICYDWLSDVRSDGLVQRVVQVATQEQLQCFSSLFRENTDAAFYDQHLWISPLVSPEGSRFSKAERLSCCWAVFNSIMLASAMWYNSGSRVTISNTVYDLEFVQFTLQELYVSVMTTLMVVPVALVPVQLFRLEIPAPVTVLGMRCRPKHGLFGDRLSRWSKYVAWLLVVTVSIVSSFFVTLYSLDWGRQKSEAWLKTFFLSFSLSSLVTETGQIFVIAILASLICTKRATKQKTYDVNKAELHQRLLDHKAPQRMYPPKAASVQSMQNKSKQRRQFYHVLKDFGLLFLFVAVLFYISHHDKEPFAFHASQMLTNTLLEDFDQITTADEFWTWTEEILLPVLYPSFWYNGWKMKYLDRQFPLYTEAFRIGPPLLTQLREEPEESQHFQNGWVVATGNATSACWQFNVSDIMSDNPDCALQYTTEIPIAFSVATSIFSKLQQNQWIDEYTQHLTFQLSFYHPSLKLFSRVRMTVRQEDIGHLSTSATVETHRLFQYENTSDYGMMVVHVVFVILFLVHFIKQVVGIKREGRKHFRCLWNAFALLSIVGSSTVICTFGIRYHFASAALRNIIEATGELGIEQFVDFSSTFWWDDVFKHLLAVVVFITTLTLLRSVRFSKTIASFLALPGAMKNDLLSFTVTGIIVFMAFTCSGLVVFGTHLLTYSNVLDTMLALFEMLMGRFFADEILEANPVVGPIFFTLFMICIFIILINFLVTIICDAIASRASVDDDYDQELVDYVWKSFKDIFGVYLSPKTGVRTDEVKRADVGTNLRMIEESLNEISDVTRCLWANNTNGSPSSTQQRPNVPLQGTSKQISASPQTSAAFSIQEQVQNILEAHEDDQLKLEEAQKLSRRRAKAMLKRKLTERRMQKKDLKKSISEKETVLENVQMLIEQHDADEGRLEQRQSRARRQFESTLRQKIAIRRMQKKNNAEF